MGAVWAVQAELGNWLAVMLDRTRKGKGSRMGHRLGAGEQDPVFGNIILRSLNSTRVVGLSGIFVKIEL